MRLVSSLNIIIHIRIYLCLPLIDWFPYNLDDEHLPFLFRALHSLASNWYGFSLQLGVSGLDKIQSDGTTVDDCLVLALQRWLKNDNTSWTVLVTAIFRPAGGGNQRLAAEVAGSYRGIICDRIRKNQPVVAKIHFELWPLTAKTEVCNKYAFYIS